jgi:inosose dehydratase
MNIKLGVSPLSWFNSDFPDVGKSISLEQCLSEASLIGYHGVELENPMRIHTLSTLLHLRSLDLVGGWHDLSFFTASYEQELERFKKHLDLLHSLHSKIAILCETSHSIHRLEVPLKERPQLNESQWDFLCDCLDKLHFYAKSQGFETAYHHHLGTVVQSAEDIQTLMEGTEELGLLLDTGHLEVAGAPVIATFEEQFSRLTHVHLKNVRRPIINRMQSADASFLDIVLSGGFTVPGDETVPSIDFSPIIDFLVSRSYKGWIVVEAEQDPNLANPFVYAQLGFSTVKALLDKAFLLHQKVPCFAKS